MATVYYETCDKCGKKMEYKGKTTKIFKRFSEPYPFKILSIFNGNPTGYDYSNKYVELCKECTKELDAFLNK